MTLEQALRGRRSIRKYQPRPVDDALLRQLLDEARWSPSWANTQPWTIWVVRGETLARLRAKLQVRTQSEAPGAPDLTMPARDAWPEEMRERTARLRSAIAASPTTPAPAGSSDFFGAPCVVFVAIDERVPAQYQCFDVGLWVQSLCLAAHEHGLGTCIMAMAVRQPDLLRELLPRTEGKRFAIGVALGYPKPAPINDFPRERASLDELVTWVD